jgi:ABC-type transport system substrate-binding protein
LPRRTVAGAAAGGARGPGARDPHHRPDRRAAHAQPESRLRPARLRPREVDRLLFRQVSDINVARAELEAGRLQFLPYDYAPPRAEIPALQRNPAFRVVFTPSHFSREIQLNLRRPPLDNPLVRQAIGHAIDRDAMNRLAFNGLWTPAPHASVSSQREWINRDAPDRWAACHFASATG